MVTSGDLLIRILRSLVISFAAIFLLCRISALSRIPLLSLVFWALFQVHYHRHYSNFQDLVGCRMGADIHANQ